MPADCTGASSPSSALTPEKYGARGVVERQSTACVEKVLWPSEKYADPALTPGGAAGMGCAGALLRRAATFKLMKERAGIVGRRAVASTLDQIQSAFPRVRVHLAGHSFGCRAIASAAVVMVKPVASMTLLQGAMSHNSFSPDFKGNQHAGGFRDVITGGKCRGPMLITYSVHDAAVGLCYPIASRILRQNSSGLGGENDPYGGLGRNGALRTPEASNADLLPEGACYTFRPGRIFNLRSDDVIRAHADIVKPEIVWALIAAAGLGRC